MYEMKRINDLLNSYLRLQTFPLAIRMCAREEELPEKVRMPQRDMEITVSLCHAIHMARRYGWSIAVDKYQSCYTAGLSMGFLPLLPDVADGSFPASLKLWGMNKEQHAQTIQHISKFDYGKYQYVLIAPVEKADFEPHLILTYGNPAQIWILLSGYLSGTDKLGLDVTLGKGAGCTSYITKTMQKDEAQFVLVGLGERLGPHPQDHECAFSIPINKVEDTIRGLESGYKTGAFRYPVPTFMRYNTFHPPGYDKMKSHLLGEDA